MKVFGASAGPNQIAKFGSLFAGAPAFTTDPSEIQSLANYLTGWFGAAIGGNSPAIEDMNALCYLFAYQLAYLMQTGTPEWDNATTYYIGSIVQDGLGNEYVSVADNNLNNAVSDATKWKGRAGILPLGSVLATFPNLTGAYTCSTTTAADAQGFVKCNGGVISDATSPMNGQTLPNINNSVFLMGSTTAGSTGGSNSIVIAHTHGAGSYATSLSGTFASSGHTHGMSHTHQWAYQSNTPSFLSNTAATSYNVASFTTGTSFYGAGVTAAAGANYNLIAWNAPNTKLYTSGATVDGSTVIADTGTPSATGSLGGSNTVTGTSGSTGSGSDSRPNFISAVYIMRIK